MTGLRFAAPAYVHLLWAVLILVAAIAWLDRRASSRLTELVSEALWPNLVVQSTTGRRLLALGLFALCGAALTIALMRPQLGLRFIRTPRVGAEIMICLDVSRSMLAEDVAPNRLERAKADIRELLGYLSGDQVGLIAFAGRASVLSPMTPDFGFLRLVLDQVGPSSVTRGGTRLEEPIRKAVAGFRRAGDVSRSILLITDGEDHDSFPLEAAKDAAEHGIRILAIGFGREEGSEITVTDPKTGARQLLRDADGNVVRSRLDGELLRKLALLTDGAYIPAQTGVLDLESIYRRHIARLTHGRLDGQSRAVRDDAFQLAVLVGLLALIAAVGVGARLGEPSQARSGRRRARASTATKSTAAALLLAMVFAPLTSAHARALPTDDAAAAAPALEHEPAAGSDESQSEPEQEHDDDRAPREIYNSGLADLEAGRLDAAAHAFETVRAAAGVDGEARYRATYNLGWVEARRADENMSTQPQQALEALNDAASWFQRAVDLRPASEQARENLELVLKRALQLADSLREQNETSLLDETTRLIDSQRAFVATLAPLVDTAQTAAGDAEAALRDTLRQASASQLTVLSDAEGLAERAADELQKIRDAPEQERDPQQAVRAVQLDGYLRYLHDARERMGQARARMRRLETERAFRRAAASLDTLKRARDRLLEPVAILDGLIDDATRTLKLTSAKAAFDDGFAPPDQQPPAWLTNDYLLESQTGLAERTDELYLGIEAGLQQLAASEQEIPAEQQRFVREISEAAPHVSTAAEKLRDAANRLQDQQARAAVAPQTAALDELAAARERFLELRPLIDLLYEAETRTAALLAERPDEDAESLLEYAPAALDLHARNSERATRVARLVDEQRDAAQQALAQPPADESDDGEARAAAEAEVARLQRAAELSAKVLDSMGAADRALRTLVESEHGAALNALGSTRAAVGAAVDDITELRSLFFNLIEHLKETARRQIELGDETETVVVLADESNPDDTALALGPLGPRERDLAEKARQIAAALAEQSSQLESQPQTAPAQDAQSVADMVTRLAGAADHTDAAAIDMNNAAGGLEVNPAPLAQLRADQTSAVDNLLAAIALLEPPRQNQQQQQEQQEQEQQQEQQQSASAAQDSDRQEEAQRDPSQLLQGVRDREAQRRAQQAERERLRYDPVEKDW